MVPRPMQQSVISSWKSLTFSGAVMNANISWRRVLISAIEVSREMKMSMRSMRPLLRLMLLIQSVLSVIFGI